FVAGAPRRSAQTVLQGCQRTHPAHGNDHGAPQQRGQMQVHHPSFPQGEQAAEHDKGNEGGVNQEDEISKDAVGHGILWCSGTSFPRSSHTIGMDSTSIGHGCIGAIMYALQRKRDQSIPPSVIRYHATTAPTYIRRSGYKGKDFILDTGRGSAFASRVWM